MMNVNDDNDGRNEAVALQKTNHHTLSEATCQTQTNKIVAEIHIASASRPHVSFPTFKVPDSSSIRKGLRVIVRYIQPKSNCLLQEILLKVAY